jgi:hypothetical protein
MPRVDLASVVAVDSTLPLVQIQSSRVLISGARNADSLGNDLTS